MSAKALVRKVELILKATPLSSTRCDVHVIARVGTWQGGKALDHRVTHLDRKDIAKAEIDSPEFGRAVAALFKQ